MTYDFIDEETGEQAEVTMSMHEAVPFGEVVVLEGRRLRRIMGNPQVRVAKSLHFESNRVRPWAGLAEGYHSSFNEYGAPQFGSGDEVARFCKASNGEFSYNKDIDFDRTSGNGKDPRKKQEDRREARRSSIGHRTEAF